MNDLVSRRASKVTGQLPSGYSGALNGGAIVNVGGNPDNAASWKYDMVFGADGRLVYYLRGRQVFRIGLASWMPRRQKKHR